MTDFAMYEIDVASVKNELTNYDLHLTQIFGKLVKYFNKLQLSDHTIKTMDTGKEIIKLGSILLTNMKSQTRAIETLLSDCSDFIQEIDDDLSKPKPKGEYVYHTAHGMLSFPGRDFIIKKQNDKKQEPIQQIQTVQSQPVRTLIPDIGYYLKVQHAANFSKIPHAIYYVKNMPGLYMRLPNDNIVKIPFPEVVDSKKEYDRKHSIRCKYFNKNDCDMQRQKMAKVYNSTVRVCNFAHDGDKIVKIGYPSRCPSVPNFGNPESISTDIKIVNQQDVKNMLMYGLHDVITSVVWLDYMGIANDTFTKLDHA